MKHQINDKFDPVFETAGLLYSCLQEEDKEEVIRELCELGLDGEKFYQKHFKLIERYIRSFKKYMVSIPNMEFFFLKDEDDFFFILTTLLVEHRGWMESMDGVTDDHLRSLIGFIASDEGEVLHSLDNAKSLKLKDDKDVIQLLMGLNKSESIKWHLLELLQRPKYWMEMFIKTIKSNIPAYEKAMEEIKKPLEPYLQRYLKYEDNMFKKVAETCAPGGNIYPTLISGVAQLVCYSQSYEGIFIEYLLKRGKGGDERKELLAARLKALGDRSKLDILCALKESNKYNLELAEVLKLSPSTMSHHMNVLFSCGFVGIEKKDGKVYYCLQKEALNEFVEELQRVLLYG